jgi:hypothetical protein
VTQTSLRRLALLALFLLLGLLSHPATAAPADAAPAVPGDLWEVTSQMTMEGMPMAMPARTQKICAPKEWKEPPAPQNEGQKCETLEFTNTPAKTTWKVRCEGKPAMTGEGVIDRTGPDAYTGAIKMTSKDGVMTINLKGKRLADCDAGGAKH